MDGFDTTIGSDDLFEGCRRLGVEPVGAVVAGHSRRSLGVEAVGPGASRSWVKISALRGVESHRQRDAELAAVEIRDVSRPALLASRAWTQDGRHWLVLQMSLAASPRIEAGNFAGAAAALIDAPWIASLKQALDTLRKLDADRMCISADEVSALIKGRFGPGAPHKVDEWHCAHGDLHWSNMTYPHLMLLDWENWGRAPRGYDAAHLLVFSCARPEVLQKIETAFAADLDTSSGRVALLAVLARRLRDIEAGALDAAYKPHVEAMARRVLAAP
ncbi:MAG TPA: hypothetical protein VEW64_01330 [Methyloceanibacter sp.]|nr:hypothetical protein [Methyloceanibacter sp.]